MSGIYRPHENTDATSSLEFKLFALTRFAGLRLIEAGAEPTPEIDSMYPRVLFERTPTNYPIN